MTSDAKIVLRDYREAVEGKTKRGITSFLYKACFDTKKKASEVATEVLDYLTDKIIIKDLTNINIDNIKKHYRYWLKYDDKKLRSKIRRFTYDCGTGNQRLCNLITNKTFKKLRG